MTVGINSIIRDGVCTKYETERRLATLREKNRPVGSPGSSFLLQSVTHEKICIIKKNVIPD